MATRNVTSKRAICLGVFTPYGEELLRNETLAVQGDATQLPPSTSFVFGSCSVTAGQEAADEEITVCGNRVLWTAGNVLRRQFTTTATVLQASWCYFADMGPEPVLLLLHCRALTVYTAKGDQQTVPLPENFTSMWPLPQSLLLAGAAGYGPCILPHPFEDVYPITVESGGLGCVSHLGGSWEGETVIWSSTQLPYIMTHNKASGLVHLWCIRKNNPSSAPTPLAHSLSGHAPRATPLVSVKTPANLTRTISGVLPTSVGRPVSTIKRQSLRLLDGGLSPAAFSPFPRSAAVSMLANGSALLLPTNNSHSSVHVIWEHAVAPEEAPSQCCLFCDTGGGVFLGMVSSATQKLKVLKLPPDGGLGMVQVVFEVPAVSAVPVCGTHPPLETPPHGPWVALRNDLAPKDLLVLQPGGQLSLYTGPNLLCHISVQLAHVGGCTASYAGLMGGGTRCQIASRPSTPIQDRVMRLAVSPGSAMQTSEAASDDVMEATSEEDEVGRSIPDIGDLRNALSHEVLDAVGLQDAVGSRVNLRLRDGRLLRVQVPLRPITAICCTVVDALAEQLPQSLWLGLYRTMVTMPGVGSGSPQSEWRDICAVLLQWASSLGSLEGLGAPGPLKFGSLTSSDEPASGGSVGQGGTPTAEGNTAWEAMLSSGHHRCTSSHQSFQWWHSSHELAGYSHDLPAEHHPSMRSAAHQQEAVWKVLYCLHSLYEDSKLHVLHQQHTEQLGQLSYELAKVLGAAEYMDHYARDLGLALLTRHSKDAAVAPSHQLPAASPESLPPANIFHCLESLLHGDNSHLPLPLLVTQNSASVSRSVQLVELYRMLCECSLNCCTALQMAFQEPQHAAAAAEQVRGVLNEAAEKLVLSLVDYGWGLAELDSCPVGVALPIRQALQQCRANPPGDWPVAAYVLIGRDDIAATRAAYYRHQRVKEAAGSCGAAVDRLSPRGRLSIPNTNGYAAPGSNPQPRRMSFSQPMNAGPTAMDTSAPPSTLTSPASPSTPVPTPDAHPSRQQLPMPYTQRLQIPVSSSDVDEGAMRDVSEGGVRDTVSDGMEGLTEGAYKLIFGQDLRLVEVRHLLCSAQPSVLQMAATPEMTENYVTAGHQFRLMSMACRTLALPLGRGAFTLGTLHPLPTEPLHVPQLCLAGCLPEQHNAIVNLNMEAAAAAPGGGAMADFTAWPEFHNGVAAGLRLAPGGPQLTRTWIVYNKPSQPSYSHAGIIMALGLTGHLSCLAATDMYRYLSAEHDATTIAVLLGMSAAQRGSCDPTISKMLFLHIPGRHPSNYPELEMSSSVQAAALAGVGLLYQGSCNRLMAEILLEEIGRRPDGSVNKSSNPAGAQSKGVTQDMEGYALAAGLALGMITLGKGRHAVGLSDLKIPDRLRCCMVGGAERVFSSLRRRNGGNADPSHPLGTGTITFDLTLGGEVYNPLAQALNAGPIRTEENSPGHGVSQTVIEGDLINLDVTSPAATLALTLMFLKTNDADVAGMFVIPDTKFALDYVRPDFIRLRVLGRALVMWDGMRPNREWVLDQLPPLLKMDVEPESTVGWV